TDNSFAWHATFPAGTFVPTHLHTKQDEYLMVLDGRIDLELDGEKQSAGPGDLVRLPRGIPHAFFNNSGKPVTALFWVAPTGRLPDLFRRIHNLPDPAEVVRLSPEYDVVFPPSAPTTA
ncbi:MAG: cupin domain-containing protein, partial [Proteobacteria bacterium]|nr:cupin domain-containing protein [Pseudomonadota bacterium]